MEIIRCNWDLYKAIYANWISWLQTEAEEADRYEMQALNKKKGKIAEESFVWLYMRDHRCRNEAVQLAERILYPTLNLSLIHEGRYKKFSRLLVLDSLLAGRKITVNEYELCWEKLEFGSEEHRMEHEGVLAICNQDDVDTSMIREQRDGSQENDKIDVDLIDQVNRLLQQDPVSRQLLRGAVNDFFSKNGLNKKVLEAGDTGSIKKKSQSQYEDEVQIYQEYMRYQSRNLGMELGDSSDNAIAVGQWPDVDDCERLYQRLRTLDWAEDMLLPLRIDPMLGVGVYLVGRSCLEEAAAGDPDNIPSSLKDAIEDNCCFVCVLGFREINTDPDTMDYDEISDSFSLMMIMDCRVMDRAEDAVHRAFDQLLMDRNNRFREGNPWIEDLKEEREEVYHLIPDTLRKYFNHEDAPISSGEAAAMERQEQKLQESIIKSNQEKQKISLAIKNRKNMLK